MHSSVNADCLEASNSFSGYVALFSWAEAHYS